MKRASQLGALLLMATLMTGCSQRYYHVMLHPGDVERARTSTTYSHTLCTEDGTPIGADLLIADPAKLGEVFGGPSDPTLRGYTARLHWEQPPPGTKRTPSPYLASAFATGLVAAGGLLASLGATTVICLAQSCDLPSWVLPTGLAGGGALAAAIVLFVIGTDDDNLGTAPIEDTIIDKGIGRVCNR